MKDEDQSMFNLRRRFELLDAGESEDRHNRHVLPPNLSSSPTPESSSATVRPESPEDYNDWRIPAPYRNSHVVSQSLNSRSLDLRAAGQSDSSQSSSSQAGSTYYSVSSLPIIENDPAIQSRSDHRVNTPRRSSLRQSLVGHANENGAASSHQRTSSVRFELPDGRVVTPVKGQTQSSRNGFRDDGPPQFDDRMDWESTGPAGDPTESFFTTWDRLTGGPVPAVSTGPARGHTRRNATTNVSLNPHVAADPIATPPYNSYNLSSRRRDSNGNGNGNGNCPDDEMHERGHGQFDGPTQNQEHRPLDSRTRHALVREGWLRPKPDLKNVKW